MSIGYVPLFVLRAIAVGHRFGFDIMDATALPSGSVYPALRRLEANGLVASAWEDDASARNASRPRRRNYRITRAGRLELARSEAKFHAVSELFAKRVRS
jgi:DNA-binding PadR family transcriptional regulator